MSEVPVQAPTRDAVEAALERASGALRKAAQADGHWVFELEADATIPAEYILLRHFLGEPEDLELEAKIGRYLRRIQSPKHHGWPLYHDGGFDVSATIKAYYALKMIGDDIDRCTWSARAPPCWPPGARKPATCSPASSSRCLARARGTWCPPCRPS
jgi:hypothetical protein